jgi:uncharacterized protein YceK
MTLGLVAPGCASVLATVLMPRVYGGSRGDAYMIADEHENPALKVCAAIDLVPSAALDTVLLPYTTYCTLDTKTTHGFLGGLR